ncbi:hypothetical protein [Lacrimispora sp. JR3]|uniref:hypothetical protein n=1 Tax=Lacrimispora sinapis TaxID=3111456 RepID=UPI003748E052
MCDRVMLTPLTPEERAFAEENHSALEWCMRIQKLDEDLYDVAAFGYLQAVKKWFARPEVRQWSFKTVVKQSVRRSIGHERERQDRQIRTVSLDDVIPGTDDLTYGSCITVDNIKYLTGEKEKKGMKISYDVPIPEVARAGRASGVETEALLEFLVSTHKTMRLEYDDPKQAKGKYSTIQSWKKRKGRDDFNAYRVAETIFIEKVTKSKRGEKQ